MPWSFEAEPKGYVERRFFLSSPQILHLLVAGQRSHILVRRRGGLSVSFSALRADGIYHLHETVLEAIGKTGAKKLADFACFWVR